MVRESYHLTPLRSRKSHILGCNSKYNEHAQKLKRIREWVDSRFFFAASRSFRRNFSFHFIFNVHMFSFACQNQNGATSPCVCVCVYIWYTIILCFERDYQNRLDFSGSFSHSCPRPRSLSARRKGEQWKKHNVKILKRFQTNFRHRIPEHINFAPCKWFPAAAAVAAFLDFFHSLSLSLSPFLHSFHNISFTRGAHVIFFIHI